MKSSANTLSGVVAAVMCAVTAGCFYEAPHHTTTTEYVPGPTVTGRAAVITTLPSGYRTVTYRGTRYYTHSGVYYQPQGSGYVVVQSPY